MAKFSIRARTIDLLGRQQIASISTAISELFKNAHDAYANNAEVDYFRDDGLFVLRDDGLGMTKEAFEERWLTIGTDSKVGSASGLASPPSDPTKAQRPLLGEKGIGRLAIAVIGRQVLVLTRANVNGSPLQYITAAYIHWGLFELPGIDLDELTIPLETFDVNAIPDLENIKSMVNQAKVNTQKLASKIARQDLNSILQDMDNFIVNPREIYSYLPGTTFADNQTGTHFFILPADEIIQDDIDNPDDDTSSRFEKNLIGFTNTMMPGVSKPNITTKFRDYKDEGAPIERLGEKYFFTPEEFEVVDHHISGRFDEYGQFRGTVAVYREPPVDYVLNWSKMDGRKTLCGPFNFSIAFIQAATDATLVDPYQYATIKNKMNRNGGLYIYKDGIRVQPYGGPDYDFLAIEKRRTQKASTGYFSFRNMMGAIELNQVDNKRLVEKAGREGFREDKAYRQFRNILMHFFKQTAADFFNETGKYSDEWKQTKAELTRLDGIKKQHEKLSKYKKIKFETDLNVFFDKCDNGSIVTQVENLQKLYLHRIDAEANSNRSIEQKSISVGIIETEIKDELNKIKQSLQVSKPNGVGLNKELLNKWLAYQNQIKSLRDNLFTAIENDLENLITNYTQSGALNLGVTERLDTAIKDFGGRAASNIHLLKKRTEEALTNLSTTVREKTKNSFRNMNMTVEEIMGELKRISSNDNVDFDYSEQRSVFEEKVNQTYQSEEDKLNLIYQQLEAVLSFTDKQSANLIDVTEALEEENIALRERQDSDLELTQIGMALNTINHEFGKTAASLRDGIRRLSSWANANPNLEQLYNDLSVSFEHLDNYLNLFTPLDRRLERKKVQFYGSEIYRYLLDVFQQSLENKGVSLNASSDFMQKEFIGFRSDYYPAFINLVDNAIYWTGQTLNDEKTIDLLSDNGDLCIRDTGPGVSHKDIFNIFEINFSRKPGGRGLGLHITKQILQRLGHDLSVDTPRIGEGATFRIILNVEKK